MHTCLYTSKSGNTRKYNIIGQVKKLGVEYVTLEPLDQSFHAFKVPLSSCKELSGEEKKENVCLETLRTTLRLEYTTKANVVLYDHQRDGIQHILQHNRCYLGDEMGLGKTMQAIVACDELLKTHSHVVVVCPASLQKNWSLEVEKCSLKPDSYYIYSYGKIPDDIDSKAILVCDEAHYIKNQTSQRSKKIIELANKVNRVIFLSGTALTKSAIDAYVPLSILEQNVITRKGYYDFAFEFCETVKTPFQLKISGVQNEHRLKQRLSKFYLGRKKDKVLNLPAKIKTRVPLGVNKKLAQESLNLYEAQERREKIEGCFATVRREIGLSKVKGVLNYIEEQFAESDESIIVFAYHKDVLKEISEHLNKTAVTECITGETSLQDRARIVQEFQNKSIKYLVCNIVAAGVGLTLTASSTVIFAEIDVTPANNLQAEDRIHRIGQTGTCNIIYLCAENSFDERLFEIVSKKQEAIEKII